MELGLSMMQSPRLEQTCGLYLHEGDIELLSLHRIKNRIGSLNVHDLTRAKLVTEMLVENRDYRKRAENEWYCLTPLGLDRSISRTIDFLQESSEKGLATITGENQREAIRKIFEKQVRTQEDKIKQWFSNNYDKLLYDKEAKIPYPVVRKMRQSFRQWAYQRADPFSTPILEFMEEVARESGLNPEAYTDYQDIWDDLRRKK